MEPDKTKLNNLQYNKKQLNQNDTIFNFQSLNKNFPKNPEFNDFSLNDIKNISENSHLNSIKYLEQSIRKESSFELDSYNILNNENSFSRKISFESFGLNPAPNQNFTQLKKTNSLENRKLLKKNLDNIPLPIFDCIYCSNEKVAFSHFSKEILNEKYYYSTSIYDIQLLNKVINNFPLIDKFNSNCKMCDLIIKHTDYIKKYYIISEIKDFYNSEIFLNKCKIKYFNLKISKKYMTSNNKPKKTKLFFKKGKIKKAYSLTKSFNNNIAVNLESPKILHNNISIQTNMNSSTNNSTSIFNTNNLFEFKENNIILDNIVENIEKNSDSDENDNNDIMKIIKMDFSRKTIRNNIEWDEDFYDIWNPKIIPIIDNDIKNNHHLHLKLNCYFGEKIKKKNTLSYSNNNLYDTGKNKNYLKNNFNRKIKRNRYDIYNNNSVDKNNLSFPNKCSFYSLKKDKNLFKIKLQNSIFINFNKFNNNDNNPDKLLNAKKLKSTLYFKQKKHSHSKNKTPNKVYKDANNLKSSDNNRSKDITLKNRKKMQSKKKNIELNIFKSELNNSINKTIKNTKIKKQISINLKVKNELEPNKIKLNSTLKPIDAKKININFLTKKIINNANNPITKKQNNKENNVKNFKTTKSIKQTKTIFKTYYTKNIFDCNKNSSIPKKKNRILIKSIIKKVTLSPKNNNDSKFKIKNLEIFLQN